MSTTAERAADEAVARVSQGLTPEERDEALLIVGTIAEQLDSFTTDDVPFSFPPRADSRTAGHIMREAAKLGFIRPSDEWRKSERVACHARPKRVWVSLLR